MSRDYRLINYLGEWQVCSKARRLVAGEARAVWIYGEERLAFCDVGRESDVVVLPRLGSTNFFGDHFNHAIDELGPRDTKATKIGGMNHAGAAQAAFDYLLLLTPPDRQLTLRSGGHVMRREMGKAIYDDVINRWIAPNQEKRYG
jgi:hypothetical protein